MTRVAVICGTGMSELSKVYQKQNKLQLTDIRIDTKSVSYTHLRAHET